MSSHFVAAVFCAAFAAALVVACAAPISGDVLLGTRDDAGAVTAFVPSLDDAGADSDIAPPVPMCVATECPYPYATCPKPDGTLPHKCSTNLMFDDLNCGTCGNVCESDFSDLNMRTRCIDGICRPVCVSGHQDCNALADDGCEVYTPEDVDNCGICNNKCPELTKGIRGCSNGECNGECVPPRTWCDPPEICVDLHANIDNCGACGNRCPESERGRGPFPHTIYICAGGECGRFDCVPGWADCNNDMELDGCETNLNTDRNNCGVCGNVCAPGQICLQKAGLSFPTCACEPHETLCSHNYCADLLSDRYNCGECEHQCSGGSNTVAACQNGFCTKECMTGWGDCDGDTNNGCETDLSINARHCGACGRQCDSAAGQPCMNGQCLLAECDAGLVTK